MKYAKLKEEVIGMNLMIILDTKELIFIIIVHMVYFIKNYQINKEVEVNPDDPFHILMNKLGITDKNTKFLYNGIAYSIGSIQTFREIGLINDSRITFSNQAIAGNYYSNII
jgi:hypothetical protein